MPRTRRSHPDKKRRTRGRTLPSAQRSAIEFFGTLADGLGIGLALSDAHGLIQYGNVTFSEILDVHLGFPVQNHASLLTRITGNSRNDFEAALTQAKSQPVDGKLELNSLNGKSRTFRVSLSSSDRGKRDEGIWILAHEVTELLETGRALHDSKGSVHLLSARLMQAQDVERRRMARDLHDSTGQQLAAALMSLARLSNGIGKPGFEGRAEIADTTALVRKVESEIRTLSYVLHPPMLDELGLRSALGWYVEGLTKRSKIDVRMSIPATLPRLSRDKEIAIFRVVQESLTNVLKHAESPTANIRAEAKNGYLQMHVEDAGHGFPAHTLSSSEPGKVVVGVGILGMRERLQQLGGTLMIESTSAGTHVRASVPLADGEEESSAEEQISGMPVPVHEISRTSGAADGRESSMRRILIADDHELMRRGIQSLLQGQNDLEVCGEATDGLEAINKVRQLSPDLVILDLSMPRIGGFSVAREIQQFYPATKILVFTNHASNQVEAVLRTLGCHGYVSKARASMDLIRGIRAVLAGNEFFNSEIIQRSSA